MDLSKTTLNELRMECKKRGLGIGKIIYYNNTPIIDWRSLEYLKNKPRKIK